MIPTTLFSKKTKKNFFHANTFGLGSSHRLHCNIFQKNKVFFGIGLLREYNFREEIPKNEPIINLPTDKLIYFPKISNEKLTYHLFTKKTLNNSYGIKEPDDDNPVELNHIDLILVPLLVFNENLYRIGYGKGFFDKTFSNKNVGNKNIKLWGVCYDFQKSFLDFEEKFDVRLDKIITEEKIYV